MTDPQTLSIAAKKVREAIADLHNDGAEPTHREIAAAAIEYATRQLLPAHGTTTAERLQSMAFLALAKELRGQPLPDTSREALAEQFPAMRPAPLPAPAEPAPAPQAITPEAIAEHLLAHPCTGPLLRGQAIVPAHTSEPVAWCRSDEFANAMKRGGSFNGWKDPGAGANKCDMRLYASPLGQAIAPTRRSERPWEGAGWIWAD